MFSHLSSFGLVTRSPEFAQRAVSPPCVHVPVTSRRKPGKLLTGGRPSPTYYPLFVVVLIGSELALAASLLLDIV